MATGSPDYRSDPLSSSPSKPDPVGSINPAGTDADLERAQSAAQEAVETAKAEATHLGRDLKEQGSELAGAARERAEGFATEQKAAGADQIGGIARAANRAADELDETSPHLASYVREAASAADDFADSLRNRGFGDILQDVTDYARREPVVFFGLTLAAGFAASRFLKSTGERTGTSGVQSSGPARSMEWRNADYRPHNTKSYGDANRPAYGSPTAQPVVGAGPTPVASTGSTPAEYPTGEVKTTDPMAAKPGGTPSRSSAEPLGSFAGISSSETGEFRK